MSAFLEIVVTTFMSISDDFSLENFVMLNAALTDWVGGVLFFVQICHGCAVQRARLSHFGIAPAKKSFVVLQTHNIDSYTRIFFHSYEATTSAKKQEKARHATS